MRSKTTEPRPPLLGDLQCFVPHQSAEKGWSRINSIQALARFVCSENTTNTATGTNSLDVCCPCGQYGLVPFYILPPAHVRHSPSFLFNHSHLYKPHCVRAWCPTSQQMWSSAQTLMGHFTFSLHRVNLQTHFVAVVGHDTVPWCEVRPARRSQWRKGKRKGSMETDLEPIIRTVQVCWTKCWLRICSPNITRLTIWSWLFLWVATWVNHCLTWSENSHQPKKQQLWLLKWIL